MHTRPILAATFLAALAASPGAARTSGADALIAAAKAAMGGAAWDRIVTWRERDTVAIGGLTGTEESVGDFRTLSNRSRFSVGPISGGGGWDGRRAWTVDSSGDVRVESSGEAIAGAIQDGYRGSLAFFFPARYPAIREYGGPRTADGATYEAVKIIPRGADPFEVWFDPATHLIAREVQLSGAQPHSFIFSDYTRYGAILAPAREIDRVGSDPRFDTVARVASIAISEARAAGGYGPPPAPADSARWPAGVDSVSLPFQLLNNHIYVEASIDGAPPTPFVFDTGATAFIEAGAAQRLGIPVEGTLPAAGFGDSLEPVGLAKVKSVSLGGFTVADQVFGVSTSPPWSEGALSSGLLGYEIAKSAVVIIDYSKRIVTFAKPASFHPPAGAVRIPITFDGHMPMIEGSLDGVDGEFEIDTGSPGPLILMRPFADAHGLAVRYGATRTVTVGVGAGGPSRALLARAGALVLGPVTIEAPVVELSIDRGGVAQSTRTAGNIGGDLLKRFTVSLDYGRHAIWLQPNALASRPEVFDRSGLSIARLADGGFGIGEVAARSAAAEAGLAPGEEIVSVDGRAASEIALGDLWELFKGPVGTSVALGVRGPRGERAVSLVLADQV